MAPASRSRRHRARRSLALGLTPLVAMALTVSIGSGPADAIDMSSVTGSFPSSVGMPGSGSLGSLDAGNIGNGDTDTLPAPTVVAEGFVVPWDIAFVDSDTALVSQRDSGEVIEVSGDGSKRVAGTIEDVHPEGETGLHGLAVHEGYL